MLYISLLKAYIIVVLQVVYVVQLRPFAPPKDRIKYYNSRIAEFQWVSGRSIKDSVGLQYMLDNWRKSYEKYGLMGYS